VTFYVTQADVCSSLHWHFGRRSYG